MQNDIQVDLIMEYLIDKKLEFTNNNILKWINDYAENCRNILDWWERNKDVLKKKLYWI